MNPSRKGVAWTALVALALGVGLGVYWCWPKFLTIFQEGNPLPVALAVAKLELTGAEIVSVTPDETRLIQKSGTEEPLTRFLAERGWRFKDRLGAAIFYERDGRTLLVGSRMFTRRYVIYVLKERP
ncbi:MAG: hypothetical protein XD63_1670 [Thermoanaerobacterales bacterium 50_218]|nr:MAG: hypothetical protein XD63_1670 [Thermoanaerobacterales bacterium 50_218]HAA89415.1 hypothetical protein [Peptococcaceae bacterium]